MPVRRKREGDPRHDLLFRIVAWLSRWQLHALMRDSDKEHRHQVIFAATMGAAALGTITAASMITKLPLLFPPLAPSAFILFTTPLAPAAAPRNIVLGHTLAVASGVAALLLTQMIFPNAGLSDPAVVSAPRGLAIFLAMGLATTALKLTHSNHPPAAASALLAAMGLFKGWIEALALISAAVILVAEAWILLRVLGGIPYPKWNHEPRLARRFGPLAGLWNEKDSNLDRSSKRRRSNRKPATLSQRELDEIMETVVHTSDETVESHS